MRLETAIQFRPFEPNWLPGSFPHARGGEASAMDLLEKDACAIEGGEEIRGHSEENWA